MVIGNGGRIVATATLWRFHDAVYRWAIGGLPSAAHEGEDGEHPAVRVGGAVDAELEEDLGDVGFDGAIGEVEVGADRLVRPAFGDEGEDFMLTRRERGEWIVVAVSAEEAGHDRRVDDGFAVVDAPQRVDEDGGGEDPLLEQVADLSGCASSSRMA